MKIKDYKCRCGHDDFFFFTPENCIGENHVGIYCSYCGKWFKWADKDERNLTMKQEQKTGKWTKETKHYKDQFQEFNYYTIKCSVCGSAPEKNWHLTNYCPNCGASMRGEEE